MEKHYRSITAFGIILLLTITTTGAQTRSDQDIAKIARESSVSLKMNNGSSGSGFFVLPDQIATSYHVVEGASWGFVSPVLQPPEVGYDIVGITAIDKENDLVILKVEGADGKPLVIRESDSNNVKIQDKVYAVGNPLGLRGNVTDGKITNLFANRLWMDANVSRGSSGGALLNSNSEVIGVVMGSVADKHPELGDIAQNLNVAIPSNYLISLLKNIRVPNPTIKPLSVEGVTGKHLFFTEHGYGFYVFNELTEAIMNIHCLVIFKDKHGQTICADEVLVPLLYAGEGTLAVSFLTSFVQDDRLYYDPAVGDDFTVNTVGPGMKQLMKGYEIRILHFEINPNILTRGTLLTEGVTGSGLRWSEKDPGSVRRGIFYKLHNHLDRDLKDIYCNIVFYDKENTPIAATLGKHLKTLPMGSFQVEEYLNDWNLENLTARVEYRVFQSK